MTQLPALLATNEFAFRYLARPDDGGDAAPGASVEIAYQHHPIPDAGAPLALSALLRELVLGNWPGGSAREQVLAVLLQVHLPATVTPFAGYGVHASYPSPRAYYPLRFALRDGASGACWSVDMRQAALTPCAPDVFGPAGAGHGARFDLAVQADFHVYAPLYKLFRPSLFALEAGHFLSEFVYLAAACGLDVRQRMGAAALCLEIDARVLRVPAAAALAGHLAFARSRNSGRFVHGFFPAPCVFGAAQLARLAGAAVDVLAQVGARFGAAARIGLSVRLCLRGGAGEEAGVYRCDAQGLALVAAGDPVDACERLYNYTNFNFRNVPAILFLCVDALSYHCTDEAFLDMNIALGFASQQLIRTLHSERLLGRPFRSYDQRGIDRLLCTGADGLRTYYGLLVAHNRSEDALGVLR